MALFSRQVYFVTVDSPQANRRMAYRTALRLAGRTLSLILAIAFAAAAAVAFAMVVAGGSDAGAATASMLGP